MAEADFFETFVRRLFTGCTVTSNTDHNNDNNNSIYFQRPRVENVVCRCDISVACETCASVMRNNETASNKQVGRAEHKNKALNDICGQICY